MSSSWDKRAFNAKRRCIEAFMRSDIDEWVRAVAEIRELLSELEGRRSESIKNNTSELGNQGFS